MITLEAPPFHIWNEGDVHELVCHDRQDLKERKAFGLRRCDIPQCDWCADNRVLKVVQS
jgi:hypothetical protein